MSTVREKVNGNAAMEKMELEQHLTESILKKKNNKIQNNTRRPPKCVLLSKYKAGRSAHSLSISLKVQLASPAQAKPDFYCCLLHSSRAGGAGDTQMMGIGAMLSEMRVGFIVSQRGRI